MHLLQEGPVAFLTASVNSPHLRSVWPRDGGYVCAHLLIK